MIKTTLIILGILILGLFIHPQKVIYEAKISGKVVDENGIPIQNATISRMEEKSRKNKKQGYIEYTKYKSQSVKTNENGDFVLEQKSRTDWFHNPFNLPFVWCYADFEISKTGYKTYKTEFGEFKSYRKENSYACENIEFTPRITLKKSSR